MEYAKHLEEMYNRGERRDIRGTYKNVNDVDSAEAGQRILGAPNRTVFENLKRKYDSMDRTVFLVSMIHE